MKVLVPPSLPLPPSPSPLPPSLPFPPSLVADGRASAREGVGGSECIRLWRDGAPRHQVIGAVSRLPSPPPWPPRPGTRTPLPGLPTSRLRKDRLPTVELRAADLALSHPVVASFSSVTFFSKVYFRFAGAAKVILMQETPARGFVAESQ